MENTFSQDQYTFKELPSRKGGRAFRVKCIETGEEKDSAISFSDAAGLLIGHYNFASEILMSNSQDQEYVTKVFEQVLGKKKTACATIVQETISTSGKIHGCITQILSENRFETDLKYKTDYFDIQVLFENGLLRGSTKIIVTRRMV